MTEAASRTQEDDGKTAMDSDTLCPSTCAADSSDEGTSFDEGTSSNEVTSLLGLLVRLINMSSKDTEGERS